ncbi:hypothetical protein [Amycolatopsis magusensis]|uniref:hypothetical protein n=1 Tax=Amycolatopsis magusensis TaxID=882444 RepID=UPI003C2C7FEA
MPTGRAGRLPQWVSRAEVLDQRPAADWFWASTRFAAEVRGTSAPGQQRSKTE